MKIMLDAGHGYNTAGKRSPDGMREYEFNRAVAEGVKDLLDNYKEITVFTAHSDERDVPLKERTDKANQLEVDCYLSIHANAFETGWNEVRGIETYIYLTKPKEAAELARKIHNSLISATAMKDRGVKTADFHVLRETKMTAVLVECGFMTNREDAALLRSTAYRKLCAEAIVKGLQEHFQWKKKDNFPGGKPAAEKGLFRVQAGAFRDRKNAEKLAQRLKKDGYEVFIYQDK